jgi:hypothetical protein
MAPPPIPPLADDMSFHSPVLTAVATGKEINQRILRAASQVYGEQKFRAVLEAEGRPAIAGVFDGVADGHTLQLVAMFGLNDRSEINEIRIFSGPGRSPRTSGPRCTRSSRMCSGPSSGRAPTRGHPSRRNDGACAGTRDDQP